MKILVLGAEGMLGHRLFYEASKNHEVLGTVGRQGGHTVCPEIKWENTIILEVLEIQRVERTIMDFKPDAVVNCIGIVKQSPHIKDTGLVIRVNSLFPRQLLGICERRETRLIHISTDCVFSGAHPRTKGYAEEDAVSPLDVYGMTKALGEVVGKYNCVTIRTSMIGREVGVVKKGLVEWFLSQGGKAIEGHAMSFFSGLTTRELSRVTIEILESHLGLSGLYHIAAAPIDKYSLLCLLKGAYGLDVMIQRTSEPKIDRTLDGTRYQYMTGYVAPAWDNMVQAMANDEIAYPRRPHAQTVPE